MTQTLPKDTVIGGRFRVVEFHQSTDVAEIYEVLDSEIGQSWVLELYTSTASRDATKWNAAKEQAADASKLAADVCVSIQEFGSAPEYNARFAVRQVVPTPSLRQQVSAESPMTSHQVSQLLTALAPGLDKLHTVDLAHRGLTPDNIHFTEEPGGANVKVTGFGHAALRSGPPEPMGWCPPEAAHRGSRPTPTTDTYALGLVTFFALTGHSAFKSLHAESPSERDLLAEQRKALPAASKRAAEFGAQLSPRLDDFFAQALATNPSRRFKSVKEMAVAFASSVPDGVKPVAPNGAGPARTATPPPPPSKLGGRPPPPPSQRAKPPSVPPPPPSKLGGRTSSAPPPPPPGTLPPPPVVPATAAPPLPAEDGAPTSSEPAAQGSPAAQSSPTPVALPGPDLASDPTHDAVGPLGPIGGFEIPEALQTEPATMPLAAPGTPEAPPASSRPPEVASGLVSFGQPAAGVALPPVGASSVSPALGLTELDLQKTLARHKEAKRKKLMIGGGVVGAILLVAIIASAVSGEDAEDAEETTEPATIAAAAGSEAAPVVATPPPAAPEAAARAPAAAETGAEGIDAAESDAGAKDDAKIVFECEPDCDSVTCNGTSLQGWTDGVELKPGAHACVATKAGYTPARQSITVVAGEGQAVKFELVQQPVSSGRWVPRKKKPQTKKCNPFKPCY